VRIKRLVGVAALASFLLAAPAWAGHRPAAKDWETAWGTAPSAAATGAPQGYAGYTFRNIVHPTAGGDRLRVHLSNRFGTLPVLFGHVTVAVSAHSGGRRDGAVDPSDGTADGPVRDVLFNGAKEVTVAAGAEVVSDPVDLAVQPDHDLLVSAWTPQPSGTVTVHSQARQISFYSRGPEDHAGDQAGTAFNLVTESWHYLSAVDVTGPPGTVVALGDSITDGLASIVGANRRWTDDLAARLTQSPVPDYAVVNAGISGNRVLLDSGYPKSTIFSAAGRSALARLEPDVLDRAGVRSVILFEGVNDIQQAPVQTDPQAIIAGLAQIAAEAHARGLKVVCATITPFEGWHTWTPAMDTVRVTVNKWIRSGGQGAFDGVADFDAAARDRTDPARLAPGYDGGDHLHPNDAGDLAMANVIPLDRL
jgi:lysophospholipase L1-like esterase